MRILVTEDNDITRIKLEGILSNWEYDVITAQDGNEAWEELHRPQAPKLVLLDWKMPGKDGVEICKKIRQEENNTPPYIILLTGKDHKEDIIEGLQAGADDYIVKPFDIDALKARIEVGQRVINLQTNLAERIDELQQAVNHIKRLQGIIPICAYCKKIRNDQESWEQMEKYISEHSDAQFSHGICPDCYQGQLKSIENTNDF